MTRFTTLRRATLATMVVLAAPVMTARLSLHAQQPQQEAAITGRVTDSTSQRGLAGVQVVVVGSTIGVRTGEDGSYRLNRVPAGEQRIRFSSIGYSPVERTVQVSGNGTATLDVALSAVAAQLAGVVVVGYGTQNVTTVTGSVSSVEGASLEASPAPNLSNSIGGKVSGVTTLNTSGEPGSDGATLRVRGIHTMNDNSPLVVIDGVPSRAGGLERLTAEDIESISVLKDASAAIYGARAANGVILVTTKRGNTSAPEITLDVNYGMDQPTRLPKMADAATYMEMLNETDVYRGLPARYTQAQIDSFRVSTNAWLYPNTDWLKAGLTNGSPMGKATLSMRGGADQLRYFLSLHGSQEQAFYKNSGTQYNQYGFRTNLDGQATQRLAIQFDLAGRLEDRNYPARSAGEIFRGLVRGKPNMPAYWPNGLPGPDIEYGDNPVVTETNATGYTRHKTYYLQSTLGGTLQIPGVEGLSVKAAASYDMAFDYNKQWRQPWTLYTWDYTTYVNGEPALTPGTRGFAQPELQQDNSNTQGVLLNAIGDYKRQFGNHSINVLVGAERQTTDYSSLSAFRKYFASAQLDELFAGGAQDLQNNGSASLSRRQNYFTRLNYSYADRYMLEFIGRRDGSYIFAPDKRFGNFPGMSAGWRISEESFFKKYVSFIDDLKLRGSWGRSGNDRVAEWQYLSSFAYGSGYVFGSPSAEVKSIYPTRTPNPDVTWETADQTNFALDASVLDNRLSFTFEKYNEKRENILWTRNASVPQSTGLTLPLENIGKMNSHGYDASATYHHDLGLDRGFDVTLNAGWTHNKVVFWDEAPGAPDYQQSTGHPINTGLYYVATGEVYKDSAQIMAGPHWPGARPGDLIFENINGDTLINGLDRIRIDKSGDPTFVGGITLNGRYGAFDASLFFQAATGAVQYISTESGDEGNYLQYYAEDRWSPTNPDGTKPRAFNGGEYWLNGNTYFLKSANYVRLKTMEVGYRLPTRIAARAGVSKARVYMSAFNALTWDKLDLMDPESRNSSGQYYPQARMFTGGISFTF